MQALLDSVPASSVRQRMAEFKTRQVEPAQALEAAPPSLPTRHPDMAKLYRRKVTGLVEALNADDD